MVLRPHVVHVYLFAIVQSLVAAGTERDVNALGVHLPSTLRPNEQRLGRYFAPHQGHGFRHCTVYVDADGLDPTAA